MSRRVRHTASVLTTTVFFAISTASAQNGLPAQTQPAAFCPTAANSNVVPDAGTPNINAAISAIQNKNYELAYSHLAPLSAGGNTEAQRRLGLMLLQSCDPKGDRSLAVSWIGKAAGAGDAPAATALGRMYMNGTAVAQDDAIAFKWLTQGASGGDMGAQTSLGVLYLTGRGVPMDLYQGILWTARAAEQGAPGALANIGSAYFNGRGLPKNNSQALFWMLNGMQRANPALRVQFQQAFDAIIGQLSVENAKRIAAEAQKWSPGPGSVDKVIEDAAKRRDQGDAPSEQKQAPGPSPANTPLDRGKRDT